MSISFLIVFLAALIIFMLVMAVIEIRDWVDDIIGTISYRKKNHITLKDIHNKRKAEQKAREAYYRDNFSIYSDRSDEAYKEKKIHDREENIKNGRVGLSKLGVVIVGSLIGGLVELCPWLAIPCIIVFFIGVCA